MRVAETVVGRLARRSGKIKKSLARVGEHGY